MKKDLTYYAVVEKKPRSVWLNVYKDKNKSNRCLFDVFDSMDEAIGYVKEKHRNDNLILVVKGGMAA